MEVIVDDFCDSVVECMLKMKGMRPFVWLLSTGNKASPCDICFIVSKAEAVMISG